MGVGSDIGGILGRSLGDIGEKAVRGFLGFKKGGRVPGKKGAPRKAVVHGGEYVLPVGVAPTKAQKAAVAKLKKGKK